MNSALWMMSIVGWFIIEGTSVMCTVPELIEKQGYRCEIHNVTTEDGYILTLHRIPPPSLPARRISSRIPILLQHGVLSSSAAWVLNTPHKAPAYVFADAGFDVWMGNVRGSSYSRRHTNLSIDSHEFWQFSWDEMGYYDLPAFLNYIVQETMQPQLYYVGYSMGATMFFSGMSLRPEFNKKIKKMYAVSPVVYLKHVNAYLAEFTRITGTIKLVMNHLGFYEVLPKDSPIMNIVRSYCTAIHITEVTCENILFLFTGFDRNKINEPWLVEITERLLSGTSLNTLQHFSQGYISGKFRRYDYGLAGNLGRYGQASPPEYNLKNVTSTVNVLWAMNDQLADTYDVTWLIANLPNRGSLCTPILDKNFYHLDFLWSKHTKKLVYDLIIEDMKKDEWCI